MKTSLQGGRSLNAVSSSHKRFSAPDLVPNIQTVGAETETAEVRMTPAQVFYFLQ